MLSSTLRSYNNPFLSPADELADELVVEAGAAVEAEGGDGAVGHGRVGRCQIQ